VAAICELREESGRFRWKRSTDAPRKVGDLWSSVVDDIHNAAGLHPHMAESFALWLLDEERPDLARRMVEIEEHLFPDEWGIARAHVEARLGKRSESLVALRNICDDLNRTRWARAHAADCIAELRRRR
jgi:hypothetical protein